MGFMFCDLHVSLENFDSNNPLFGDKLRQICLVYLTVLS